MKCVCCDTILTDFESTRKHAETGEYLDTCAECFGVISEDVTIPTLDRSDLFGKYDALESDPELDNDDETW